MVSMLLSYNDTVSYCNCKLFNHLCLHILHSARKTDRDIPDTYMALERARNFIVPFISFLRPKLPRTSKRLQNHT